MTLARLALALLVAGFGVLPWYDVPSGFWRFEWMAEWPLGAAAPFVVHALRGALGAPTGLGAGALLAATGLVFLAANGFAARGALKGERFTAATLATCVVLTGLFVFYPVARVLADAFVDADGHLALAQLAARLAERRIWSLACLGGDAACGTAWNTLALGLATGALTTTIGIALALVVVRTRAPGRGALGALAVLPIVTPPFVIGLALILVFGRSGLVNQALDAWFGIPPSRWFYGADGVLVAQVFAFTPVAFLILRGAVEGISPTLEEASTALHASPAQTFRRVTLPLLRPGVANAFLVGFIESIADFGNPLLLGGNFTVLATDIYFAIVGAQHDPGRAAALAIILLGLALGAFLVQRRFLAGRSFVTVAGKGDAGLAAPLHPSARRTCVALAAPFALLTVVIYAMALAGGLVELWGRDYTFTLKHFARAFSIETGAGGLVFSGSAWASLWNTLLFSAIAAPVAAALGLASAWLIERVDFPGRRTFEFMTLVSFAIPGTIIGVAYVVAFNVPPIEITGSGLIIVLSLVFRNVPLGVRAGAAAFAQIDRSLDEASATLGARAATGLRRVLAPLLKPAIVATLVYSFVRSVTTVSAIVFLVSGETEMATTFIIGRAVNGDYGTASAYSAALIVLMVVAIVVIQAIVGERRLGRRGFQVAGGAG